VNIEDMTREVVNEQLGRVLRETGWERWWETPIPATRRHVAPNTLIQTVDGRGELLKLVTSYLDPSFS
jgi:hypothetical protein